MIHSIIHFLFNVIIVIMDIFQLICLINIITYDFSKFEMIEYLYKNWSYNLIKNIKIEYQSSPLSYNNMHSDLSDNEPLINITFPAIVPGCDCSLFNNKIYKGYCTQDLINKNCYTIEPIETNNLNNLYLPEIDSLSSSNNGIIIYIERYENLSYLDLLSNSNNEKEYFISNNSGCQCDKSFKVCIDCGVIDTFGNHLCISSYKGINNNCYKIKLEYDYSLKDTKLIKKLNMIFNDTNNNEINYNNKSKSYLQYPVEFLTLFNSDKICILQDESISSPIIEYNLIYSNNLTNIFSSGPKNKGCLSKLFFNKSIDNRWVQIYNFPFEYTLNQNLKRELKRLPLFPYNDLINKNISLAYRNFIGINIKCINSTIFIKDNMINYEMFLKIRFLLLLFFSLIFFPSFLLFFMMITQIDILTFYQKMFLSVIFSMNVLLFLEYLYFELIDMNEKHENFKIIANNFCGDDLTNNLFFGIVNDFENLQSSTLFCCYWTIIMFLATICKMVLIVTKSCKNRIMYNLNSGNSNIITEVEMQLIT